MNLYTFSGCLGVIKFQRQIFLNLVMLLMRLYPTHISQKHMETKASASLPEVSQGRVMVKHAKNREAACVLGHINRLKSDAVMNVQ